MMTELTAADELEHGDVAVEAWWWWAWKPDASAGVFVGLELRGRQFDYWAGLVRTGERYLYVAELDGHGRRAGLELKPPELWADHQCDVPFRQWTVANEAYGVLLDPAEEAWGSAYGERTPVAIDMEWMAAEAAIPEDHGRGFGGYSQRGSADVVVELHDGNLHFDGPAMRVHRWGAPWVPRDLATPVTELVAPYMRSDGRAVLQVLGRDGFLGRTVAR